MLDKLILYSIKNKLIIGIFTLILVCVGIYSVTQLPIDAVPDITDNQVQIITNAPSSGAEDIERFVTFPVEQTMSTIPGISEVRSFSRFGLSVVTIVFEEGVDIYWARGQVNERLQTAKNQIPKGLGNPEMAPLSTGLGEIYQYILSNKKGYSHNLTEMRSIQDWIVRRQLLGVKGIADVSSFGGFLKQYEVAIDPNKLKSLNTNITEVFKAIEQNNQNAGGAYIDKQPNTYFIKSEGLVENKQDIENIVIRQNPNGVPLLVRNVAKVQIGAATRFGAMTKNAEGEVVGGIVLMLKGANSSKVIGSVKERIAQIEKNLPEGIVIEPYLDRTKLVNTAISTVTKNLAEGALIVIFVLVLLLGNFRAGLIVASVIPLALLFAITLMNLFGVSGNLMSLGALDFGLIVDGAVIIVEATLHHFGLKKANQLLTQENRDREVYESASKIRDSAAFGEIIILIVYLPILVLVGIEGKMFKPMAQTVSFAIIGAFILSLTYIPMMSALFLRAPKHHKKSFSDKIMEKIQFGYLRILRTCMRWKKTVIGTTVVVFALSLIVYKSLGAEFTPTLEEGDFAVETRVLAGSSMLETVAATQNSAKVLLKYFPEVKKVIGKIGSSEIPTDPMPVEAADMMVILKDKADWTTASNREELAELMQAKLEQHIPGVTFGFQQPIQMRFNELMTGVKQDVAIKIYGEDFNKLQMYAEKIGKITNKIEGVSDLYVEEISGQSQIVTTFNREQMASFGLNIADVNTVIKTAFAGESAGYVFENEKRFDLVVRMDQGNRKSIEDVRNLLIPTIHGEQIPLRMVADVDFKKSPNQIQRDDTKRRIIVAFNVRGRDVESIVNELQAKVDAQIQFEAGYFPTYGGTFKNLQEANLRLGVAVPIALLLILILLYFTFKSLSYSILIFSAIPLSAIGGIIALWMRDMPFSISAGIGFIALFGVVVLNGIVLIGEFNRLKSEGMNDIKERIFTGTSVRLRPVIMTGLVASLGFLPMAFGSGSGGEVQKPLATVVIGGLLSATLLTLVVLPILYYWLEKRSVLKWNKSIAILGLFVCLTSGFYSQEKITLEQAISQGLKHNATIQLANLNITQLQKLKKASYEIPKTDLSVVVGQANSIERFDNNFGISQVIPFPTYFKRINDLGKAKIAQGEMAKKVAENELIYKIKMSFVNLQYTYALLNIYVKRDSILKEVARATNLRYKTGESTLLEKTQVETQELEIENQLFQIRKDIEIGHLELGLLIGSNIKIQIAEVELKPMISLNQMDSASLKNNPLFGLSESNLLVAKNQKQLVKAGNLPDVKLGYFNQTLVGTQNINGTDVYFNASKRFQGVSLGVSIPLFLSVNNAKKSVAIIEEEKTKLLNETNKLMLENSFKIAQFQFEKYTESAKFFQEISLPKSEQLLINSQKSFNRGEIDYTDYLTKVGNSFSIQENYLQTLVQQNLSVIMLSFLVGQ